MTRTTKSLHRARDRDRAAAIILVDRHLLLMERFRPAFGRYFVMPGGGVESGENPRAAVIRELREETGLRATVVREVFRGVTRRGNRHTYYLCRAPKLPVALPRSAEENEPERIARRGTTQPRWVEVSRLAQLRILPPTLKPLLQRAVRSGFPRNVVRLRDLGSGPSARPRADHRSA